MQRQSRIGRCFCGRCGIGLDGEVVCANGDDAGVRYPLQQFFVAAIQHRTRRCQECSVGLLLHFQDQVGKAGVQAEKIAHLDGGALRVQRRHQAVVADQCACAAMYPFQINHHTATLYARRREMLDADRARTPAAIGFIRTDQFDARAVAVVVDLLGPPVAVGIEHLTDVAQAVPLRRILQEHEHRVIGHHIAQGVVHGRQLKVEVEPVAPSFIDELGGLAMLEQHIATGIVQRQTEAKSNAVLDFPNRAQARFRRQQVHPTKLVVRAKIAPVGSFRAIFPARVIHCDRFRKNETDVRQGSKALSQASQK